MIPRRITFAPGINPAEDETNQNTVHLIAGNNVRFYRGGVEKIGGNKKEPSDDAMAGTPRAVLSFENAGVKWTLTGTNSKLYARTGATDYNITPLLTSSDTLGTNPITSRYDNVQTNPFNTTSGSDIVSVNTFLYDELVAEDYVTISGVGAAVNGIPAGDLNATHRIISMNATSFNIRVATPATSTGSPAVASVVIAVKKVKITDTAHGLSAGDRIKISGVSGAVGGIPASEVNKEHIISVIETANTYVVNVDSAPTSLASGGGASVLRFKEIAAGGASAVSASGVGIGLAGYGLPGSIQTDDTLLVQPRIWWIDMFGDTPLMGYGTDCYEWGVDVATAPTIISNAPDTDIGWVEGAKLVSIKDNVVANSDVGDYNDWTAGVASSAYSDAKEDMNKVVARVDYGQSSLIFAEENRVFLLTWVGGAIKWRWQQVSNTLGIVSPNGAITVASVPYVFGEDNFYYFNGGAFMPIPNNTLLRYVFDDINLTQKYKFFVWYNQRYNELNFHYCSGGSSENDRAVIYSITEQAWSIMDGIARTAADKAGALYEYPLLAGSDGYLYEHEIGNDSDTSAMNAWAQIAFQSINDGKNLTDISGMEIDLILAGDATLELHGKYRSMADSALLESFTITPTTEVIDCGHETRWRSWLLRSNTLGGHFRWGGMCEFIDVGSEY